MFQRNAQQNEDLLPYLEGGLDEAQGAQMQARLAADPALAAEAARLGRTVEHLRQSAARMSEPTANSVVPADLWPRLRQRLEPSPAPPRPVPVWWMAGVGAAAALAFAALWLPMNTLPPPPSTGRPQAPKMASAPRVMPPMASPRPVAALGPAADKSSPAPVRIKNMVASRPAPPTAGLSDPFAVPTMPSHAKVMSPVVVPSAPPQTAAHPVPIPARPTLMASRDLTPHNSDGLAGAPLLKKAPSPVLEDAPAPPAPAALPVPAPPLAVPPAASSGMAAPATPIRRSDADGNYAVTARSEPQQTKSQQTKSQPNNLPQFPGVTFGKAGLRANAAAPQGRVNALHQAAPAEAARAAQTYDADAGQMQKTLDTWQAALARSVQPPLLGADAGAQQANQALMSARESGALDTLRARLEEKRGQTPRDIVTARMLAAVYEFGFSAESALRERRRLVGLDNASGEDWFSLAQAEERAGNGQAAQAAYKRALDAPAPLSSFHAALARQRS